MLRFIAKTVLVKTWRSLRKPCVPCVLLYRKVARLQSTHKSPNYKSKILRVLLKRSFCGFYPNDKISKGTITYTSKVPKRKLRDFVYLNAVY